MHLCCKIYIHAQSKAAHNPNNPIYSHPFRCCAIFTGFILAHLPEGDKAQVTMGTGVYETTFKLSKEQAKKQWSIDLGDVRESARVYINGHYIGCAWAVPYILHCKDALSKGKNTIRIEVTNLPANRIAALDREGVKWRKMKEINVVDINYKKTTYDKWEPVPSGLNSTVKLVEVK